MMRDGIFVTGASGFVGRRLLGALGSLGRPVWTLERAGQAGPTGPPGPTGPTVTVTRGDLLQPETYRDALRFCSVVVHLAAATGKASAETHVRVNAEGTEILLEECGKSGVEKVLFVSSIATTFPDKTGYHYALAKSRAEQAVAKSGLRFAILRPTIILGPDAPLLAALEKLALLPLIVMPGNGRARVQPIHVDDVVRGLVDVVRFDMFAGETYEIGGPETVTMEALLQRIRRARTGQSGRVLRIPLALLRLPLRVVEAVGLGRLLPMTAGQLTSFRFDGVAQGNRLQDLLATGLVELLPMVSGAVDPAAPMLAAGAANTLAAGAANTLDAECRVFTRHLLGCDPDAYVLGKYRVAHDVVPGLSAGGFDRSLVGFARMGRLCARVADSYASVFARGSLLRKKLVILLAILETRSPFHSRMDKAIDGPVAIVVLRLGIRAVGSALSLIAGTLILFPTRVVLALAPKGPR